MNTAIQPHDRRHSGHMTPNRNWWQLFRLNALQFGVAFAYAIATALSTPILLSLGLPSEVFGIGWLLGPVLGCLLSPILMVASEGCRSSWGRRRPFLLALGMGIIIGIVLYLNGVNIGVIVSQDVHDSLGCILITLLGVVMVDFCCNAADFPSKAYLVDVCDQSDINRGISMRIILGGLGGGLGYTFVAIDWMSTSIGIALGSQLRVICLFSVALYTLSLALTLFSIPEVPRFTKQQSYSSAEVTSSSYCCCWTHTDVHAGDDEIRNDPTQPYLVRDTSGVTQSNDRVENEMVNDDENAVVNLNDEYHLLANELPPPERPISRNRTSRHSRRDRNRHGFVSKRTTTTSEKVKDPSHLHSFRHSEVERDESDVQRNVVRVEVLGPAEVSHVGSLNGATVDIECYVDGDRIDIDNDDAAICPVTTIVHNRVSDIGSETVVRSQSDTENRSKSPVRPKSPVGAISPVKLKPLTVKYLVKSSFYMPCILRWFLFTCYLSWTAFLTMLLFFTDYMGQVVYLGDPSSPQGTESFLQYNHGVTMGCWGLCIFSCSAAITGLVLTHFKRFLSLRTIFVFGQLIFAIGCGALLLTVQYPYVTISLCVSFGIEFAVITKVPTDILAVYHQSGKYSHPVGGLDRTMPSDLACLGGQVFFAQITVSTLLGPIVHSAGTRLALVVFASFTGFVSCVLSACFITYDI